MKFMLLIKATGREYDISHWPKTDLQAHIGFMVTFARALRETGELVRVEGLAAAEEAKVVSAGKDGAAITRDAFSDTREFVAGYWIVDVDSPRRACEIAAQASAAPGPGGTPLDLAIEVRQVMSCSSPELP